MIVIMTMDETAVIRVGQRDALVLTCEREEEVLNEVNLVVSQLYTSLIESHVIDSVLESLTGTVMVIWPCMLDVAKAWHLETMAVTLLLSLLEASIVLNCDFLSSFLEVMSAESHEFV